MHESPDVLFTMSIFHGHFRYVEPLSIGLLALSTSHPFNHGRQVDRSTCIEQRVDEDNIADSKANVEPLSKDLLSLSTRPPVNPRLTQVEESKAL